MCSSCSSFSYAVQSGASSPLIAFHSNPSFQVKLGQQRKQGSLFPFMLLIALNNLECRMPAAPRLPPPAFTDQLCFYHRVDFNNLPPPCCHHHPSGPKRFSQASSLHSQ